MGLRSVRVPSKEDVYPKSRTMKRSQDFRSAGFTNLKNIIVQGQSHGSRKLAVKGLTEFAEKMQKGMQPLGPSKARSASPGPR